MTESSKTTALAIARRVFGRGGVKQSVPSLVLIGVALWIANFILPIVLRNPLWETAAWGVFLLLSFVGWGSLVRFIVSGDNERVDLGLRAAWGAATVCFIGGWLMSVAMMNRSMTMVLAQVGFVLTIASLIRERTTVHHAVLRMFKRARLDPRQALMVVVVALVVALSFLAAVADWHTNPYDDDIAYLAFVQKLRDTGTVLEPFSFRRLSALGGQTLFLALVSIRASPIQANTFDRGICVVLIAMLIAGHRQGRRKISTVVALLTVILIITLPSVAINTASYYSGIVFFLALYRTLVWMGDHCDRGDAVGSLGSTVLTSVRSAFPIAILSSAACTLRQNYLPVPVFILVTSYTAKVFLSSKGVPWAKRFIEPIAAAALTVIALLPWLIVSQQSSGTFLYPIIPGTFNRALDLKAAGLNFWREAWVHVWTAIDGTPMKTLGLFVLAAAMLPERGEGRRPIWSIVLGSAVGFVLLVHGLTQGDAGNIGRYAFAFLITIALSVMLRVGVQRFDWQRGSRRPALAVAIALFATLAQLVVSRAELVKPYEKAFHNIEELAYSQPKTKENGPYELEVYKFLQLSVPEGARMAVLLDEPHYLDYRRNPIWNLDMPGYASLPPGMPFFQGPAKLKEYFQKIGVRYLAFVRPQYSRYHYRRDYWVGVLAHELEIWRAFAPYLLDFIDRMTELEQSHHHLYDWRGMVVFDLETPEAQPKKGEPPR